MFSIASVIPAVNAFTISVVVASALLPASVIILKRRRMVDVPNNRSSHSIPTLRGAGLALAPSALIAVIVGAVPMAGVIALLGSACIGAYDDWQRRPATVRLVLQIVVGVGAGFMYQRSNTSSAAAANIIVATFVLALVLCINAVNFMDGINGISAVHGAIFGAAYAWILWDAGQRDWVPMGLALVGVSVAFLPWNAGKSARLFLGDSGSYLFGGMTGALVAVVCIAGPGWVVAIGPIAIYLADVLGTLGIRLLRRASLLEAHRDHTYQRLTDCGSSHSTATVGVAACSTASSLLAIAVARGVLETATYVVLTAVIAVSYFVFGRLLSRRVRRPA